MKPFEPVLHEGDSIPAYFRSLAHQFIEWANQPRPQAENINRMGRMIADIREEQRPYFWLGAEA